MSEKLHESLPERAYGKIARTKEALMVSLGIILVDIFAHNEAGMRAGADVAAHFEKAFPSLFVAPNTAGELIGTSDPVFNNAIDIATETGPAAASIALLKSSGTSFAELAALGAATQLAVTTANAAAVQEGMLSHAESKSQDVGFSAIYFSFITKWVFDKLSQTESERKKRAMKLVAGLVAGGLVVGLAVADPADQTTNLISHGIAVGSGVAASELSRNETAKKLFRRLDILGRNKKQ